jgi:CBS-domain-containing membrane protein
MAHNKLVQEIMTKRVVTLYEEDNLQRIATELRELRFRHLPVVDDGKLVGILSQRDLLRATVNGVDHSPLALAREARFLEQTFVRDLMRTDVLTARPDEPIKAAAERMLGAHIGALPVVDGDGMLIGIVTENDIMRAALSVL